jgi:hypothetical protein
VDAKVKAIMELSGYETVTVDELFSKLKLFEVRDGNGAIPVGFWQNVLPPERIELPRSPSPIQHTGNIFPRPRPRVGIRPPTGIPTPTNPRFHSC